MFPQLPHFHAGHPHSPALLLPLPGRGDEGRNIRDPRQRRGKPQTGGCGGEMCRRETSEDTDAVFSKLIVRT